MEDGAIRLVLIPGSGSDRRIFSAQFERLANLMVPEWLPPRHLKEPLAEYAVRLAATIDTSRPFILGGLSLGGMIAQEMAPLLKPKALLLISTASTSKALPWYHRLHGKLWRAMPDKLVGWEFRLAGKLTRKFARKSRYCEAYASMLEQMPPRLVRWQSGAATEWALSQPLTLPVLHIHGKKDKIVPLKNVTAQAVIDGGHLINATHPAEVNRLITGFIGRFSATTPATAQESQLAAALAR